MDIFDVILTLVGGLIGLMIVLGIIFIAVRSVIYVPRPNEAVIVTGRKDKKKIDGLDDETSELFVKATGERVVVIPFIHKLFTIPTNMLQAEVKTETEVHTKDKMLIGVDGNINFQVDTSPRGLKIAAINFVGLSEEEIVKLAKETVAGQIRETIGSLDFETLLTEKKSFQDTVISETQEIFDNMGLTVIDFSIQGFSEAPDIAPEDSILRKLSLENEFAITQSVKTAEHDANRKIQISEDQNAIEISRSELQRTKVETENNLEQERLKNQFSRDTTRLEIQRQEEAGLLEIETKKRLQEEELTLVAKERAVSAERLRKEEDAKIIDAESKARIQEIEESKNANVLRIQAQAEKDAASIRLDTEKLNESIAKSQAEQIKVVADAEAEAVQKMVEAGKFDPTYLALEEIKHRAAVEEAKGKALGNVKFNIFGDGDYASVTKNLLRAEDSKDKAYGEIGIDYPGMVNKHHKNEVDYKVEAETSKKIEIE